MVYKGGFNYFPGVSLGVLASQALSELSPARKNPTASLYPRVEEVREVSRSVALAVGLAAQRAGVAEQTAPEELERRISEQMWEPHYPRLRLKKA